MTLDKALETIATQRERIVWLESELGLTDTIEELDGLVRALGVKACVAKTVLRLYRAKGRTLTKLQIAESIHQVTGYDYDDTTIVRVCVHYARTALGLDAIRTVWGGGYGMTPAGMERVRAVLEGERRMAA